MELVALCADGISGSASLGFLAQSGPIKPFCLANREPQKSTAEGPKMQPTFGSTFALVASRSIR